MAGGVAEFQRLLVWVDREGVETSLGAPPRAYVYPRLSSDGTRVAVFANDRQNDIWVWDLRRPSLTRVTFDADTDTNPLWMPDGSRVIFRSNRGVDRFLFWWAADGSGAAEEIIRRPHPHFATAATNGRRLIFTETNPATGDDVMQLEFDGRHVVPLVASASSERNGVISPNNRWLAFETNRSGQFEIVVVTIPELNGHWQVSTGGGTRPLWSHDGRELFYTSPAGAIMRVGVEQGPAAASTPTQVVKEGYRTLSGVEFGRHFDVSLDGRRFLMVKDAADSEGTTDAPSLVVIQNWHDELKRRVPAK